MPITQLGAVGGPVTANAGVNLYTATGSIAAAGTFTTDELDVPGLSRIGCCVVQTAGVQGLQATLEVGVRWSNQGTIALQAVTSATMLDPSGSPTVFEFIMPVETIRVTLTNGGGNAAEATVLLFASG